MQHQFAKLQLASKEKTVGASSPLELFFVRTLADAVTYFVASLAGFACLLIARRLVADISEPDKITGGLATTLIFLVSFGLLGITGKLPDVYLSLVKKII